MTFLWLMQKKVPRSRSSSNRCGETQDDMVQSDHGVEDLMRWWLTGVMNIHQFYLMVDGRILPHDSSASLTFWWSAKGCTVRVQARLRGGGGEGGVGGFGE